jgi:hypothetical protein
MALNQTKYFEIFKGCLLTFFITIPIRKKLLINIATKPSITIVPSNAGKGIAALLLPLCRIESSTTLSMAEIIKQQLQIKTILENVRTL